MSETAPPHAFPSFAVHHWPLDRIGAAWLVLLLFGVYLLSFSGHVYSSDGLQMLAVSDSLVKRGEFNTNQMWRFFRVKGELGMDGESYAKYGYGASLLAAPLYALALALPNVGLAQTALLASSIAMALAGGLLYLAARRLNFSRLVSLVGALLFALATPAWVYAKEFWSEPFALVTLLAAFYFLLCFRAEGHLRDALTAGLLFALAVAVRVTNLALVPFFAWYGFGETWREPRVRLGLFLFFVPVALGALSIAGYNWVRFGNIFKTGYRPDEQFDNPLLLGMYGLLFSPGKGLLVYAPFFAALIWSTPQLLRRHRRETILFVTLFALYLGMFSSWHYWSGGTGWGPRFLTPMLPFLVLALAPAVELALPGELSLLRWNGARRLFALLFAILCLWGIGVELLGISVSSQSYHLHVVNTYRLSETSEIFDPAHAPWVGYFALLRPSTLHFAWIRPLEVGTFRRPIPTQVDWPVIALTMTFIALCAVMFRRSVVGGRSSAVVCLACALAVLLALFSMYRYREDPRWGSNDGYRQLLQQVYREAAPREVMILNDDAVAPFFLNENRATLRWYGLSRNPAAWDNETRALLTRLVRQYRRIWFAFDDVVTDVPDRTREWLDRHLRRVKQWDFDDGVHLYLYQGEGTQ